MESFFARYKNPLILIVILLAQTIGLAIQVPRRGDPSAPSATDPRSVSLLRYWVVSIVTPFERFFNGIGYYSRHGWSNYIDLRHVRQQNADLRQQLADMRLQQAAVAQDALQGHRLQALLDFQQHYVAHTVAAQVIGTSGSDLSRVIYIDKGREDGLKPDQAVITPDGIVGKIRDVFPHTAQVLLIDDQSSGAGVLLASSRIRAILHGTPPEPESSSPTSPPTPASIPAKPSSPPEATRSTPAASPSAPSSPSPPIPTTSPTPSIQVRPAANLSQLEEVLVITATQPDLPLSAQTRPGRRSRHRRSPAGRSRPRRPAKSRRRRQDRRRDRSRPSTQPPRRQQLPTRLPPKIPTPPSTPTQQPKPHAHPPHSTPTATPPAPPPPPPT